MSDIHDIYFNAIAALMAIAPLRASVAHWRDAA